MKLSLTRDHIYDDYNRIKFFSSLNDIRDVHMSYVCDVSKPTICHWNRHIITHMILNSTQSLVINGIVAGLYIFVVIEHVPTYQNCSL